MIRYKIYKSNRAGKTKDKYYARAIYDEMVDLDGLAEHMSNHNTPYSKGAIKGMLTDMVVCIKELLLEGKAVKIPDLAIFYARFNSFPADTAEDFRANANISNLHLAARGTGDFSTVKLNAGQSIPVKEATVYDIDKESSTQP